MPETVLPVELPLQLSPNDRDEYAAIGKTVLEQTLSLYVQHLKDPRDPDPQHWKLLKRRERIAIYASREKNPATAFHNPRSFPKPTPIQQSAEWVPQCKLRCVGSLLGTLEDAMYGGVTPTETSMVMRSLSIQDEFVEHKTLCDITTPTEEEPFTYVGLKWSTRSSYLATMVKPRDMAYVECTGLTSISIDGQTERIGYAIYHSVDLPQLPPLTDQGSLRSRMSLAVLSRESGPGNVEVFSTIASAGSGRSPRKVTTLYSAVALIAIHKITENAMKKKLGWMQAARIHGTTEMSNLLPAWTPQRRESFFGTTICTCPQCLREFSSLRAESVCHICDTSVCSRCITSQKLVLGRKKCELRYRGVPVCKGCLSTAMRMGHSRELAIYEFVRPFQSVIKSIPVTKSILSHDELDELRNSSSITFQSVEDLSLRSTEEMVGVHPAPQEKGRFSNEQLRLWNQINELRAKAEETYRFARNQTIALQEQQRG